MRPSFVIINIMFCSLLAAAWAGGLLAPFVGASRLELVLLAVIGICFMGGQVAIATGELDDAIFIAHLLPKAGIVGFVITFMSLANGIDLGSAAKTTFISEVIKALGLNGSAVMGLIWLEVLIRMTGEEELA